MKLKPCPFCRATSFTLLEDLFLPKGYTVECFVCGHHGQTKRTKGDAFAAWNRRAGERDIEDLRGKP